MEYTFSWGAFIFGLLILLGGGAFTLWYRQIADALGSSVVSYNRYLLYGLIACGVGILIMLNLHAFILHLILSQFFGRS